jgi:TIR domain
MAAQDRQQRRDRRRRHLPCTVAGMPRIAAPSPHEEQRTRLARGRSSQANALARRWAPLSSSGDRSSPRATALASVRPTAFDESSSAAPGPARRQSSITGERRVRSTREAAPSGRLTRPPRGNCIDPRMASFFISHSRQDKKAVEHLRDVLRSWGYESLFLDVDPDDGLDVGVDWEAELYRKLHLCDAVIFVGTSAAAVSRWCFAELTLARSAQKPIFPLRFDDSVSLPLLDRQQWLRIDGDQAAFDHLRRVLTQRFPPGRRVRVGFAAASVSGPRGVPSGGRRDVLRSRGGKSKRCSGVSTACWAAVAASR